MWSRNSKSEKMLNNNPTRPREEMEMRKKVEMRRHWLQVRRLYGRASLLFGGELTRLLTD